MTTETPITNPYVGPRTFTYEDRNVFFGREREARDLLARVLSERLLLFYAQSGAGKSSLLYTRLIPQLQEEKGFVVLPIGRVGGDPPAGVGPVDNIYAFNLMLSIDAGKDPARLAHVTLSDFLARLARRTLADDTGQERKGWVYDPALQPAPASATTRRYALIIDQFEEIITTHAGRWQEREEFFRQVNQAMLDTPNLWIVLTLREDYVAALDPYAPLLVDRLRARFYMARMGLDAALEAIRRPAEMGGRPFAPDVAEALCNDLAQVRVPGREETATGQYVEPVQLQVVCYQLWENIKSHPAGSITAADLREAGDVDRALITFYEDTLKAVLAQEAVQKSGTGERQLRLWFDTELITAKGTRDLVRQGEEATGSLPNAVVDQLQKRFILRSETRSGDTRVELVHDRFVEPIRESNRAWFARNLNPLTQAAGAWLEAGRPESLLYAGAQLATAAAQLHAHRDEFGEMEQEFVEASQKAEDRRSALRQRRFTWIAAALALVFIALAAWALWSREEARASAVVAVSARATAEADRIRAVAAEEEAVIQALSAQDARDTAIYLQGRESVARSQAEANATAAFAAKGTAEAASTQAVAGMATAQAANTAQVRALNDLAANLEANVSVGLTAQVWPLPSPTSTPAPALTPTRTSTPRTGTGGPPPPPPQRTPTGTPTPTRAPTRAPALTPTPNRTISAQQTQLAQVRATQTALAVAPPQGRILFASNRSGPNDLYRISPNGGDAARVTSNTGYLPGYAPGADRIVFTTERRGRVQLATIRPDGSDESVLDTTPNDGIVWDDWDPAVAPDGRQVAFVSTRDNQWDIYSLNLTTGAVRRLTTDPARDYSPAWSPDGRRIAFASERSGMTDRPEIWVMNADGSNPVRLTANGVFDAHPKWSPDGGKIAFASDRDDNRSIYVMNANGANVRRLTASPWMDQYPAWSSDGDWLVFDRRTRENRAQLYLVDATGSQLRPVANSASSDWGAIWLPG